MAESGIYPLCVCVWQKISSFFQIKIFHGWITKLNLMKFNFLKWIKAWIESCPWQV